MPRPSQSVCFSGFTLELEDQTLLRGGEIVPLRPKALAILLHLVTRRPRLVTKEELLETVWPDTVVGEWVLTTAVKELRQALDDDPRTPAIIETVHRRGYRFIAPVHEEAAASAMHGGPEIVGRAAELEVLENAFRVAATGRREIVFVVGEAGIGKSALVDTFVARRATDASCLVVRGQCLEQFSAPEPYLPLLDGFGRIETSEQGRKLTSLLARHAPSWRGLLPGLSTDGEPSSAPAAPDRMLREMVSAIETTATPLVLVLEDLHWSDYSTLDVVNRLARSRASAPVMVVATYRAADLALREHPLKTMHRELRAQSLCRDVWLPPLATDAVADYVARRFPGLENVPELARQIALRTDGNALFVVNVSDELESSGRIERTGDGWTFRGNVAEVATAVPPGLRQLIAMRVDRFEARERDLLEACSVVGRTATAAEVAAAVDMAVDEVDTVLASVARRLFVLHAAGESAWPDGTVSGRYEFAHSLYRDVLLDLAPPARRRLWHERIARRIESGFAGHTADVASSLARHLEAAGLGEAAVPFFEEAAERASYYGAEREAVVLLDRAVAILESLPKTPDRMLKTIRLSMGLAQVLHAKNGFANEDSERAFVRAWALAEELNDVVQLFQAAVGLISCYAGRAKFEDARRVAARMPELMEQIPLPPFTFAGHLFLGIAVYHSGSLAEAQRHFAAALDIGDIPQPAIFVNLNVVLLSYRALAFAHQGSTEEAVAAAELAMRRTETERPFAQAVAATWAMFVHVILGNTDRVEATACIAERIGTDNGYALPAAIGRFGIGWVAAQRGSTDDGLETMRRAIEDFRASRQATALPALLSWMAEVLLAAHRPEAALQVLTEVEARIRESGEVRFTAEVLRLQGECRLAMDDVTAATSLFERAAVLAREQGAGWWVARALKSLAALQESPLTSRRAPIDDSSKGGQPR